MNELTLEFLAFAEGRFLTIHPFQNFNGRTIRLFLAELMRRLDLPGVVLAPEGEAERADYFLALEAPTVSIGCLSQKSGVRGLVLELSSA